MAASFLLLLAAITAEWLCCQTLLCQELDVHQILCLRELEAFEKFKLHFNYSTPTRQNINDYFKDIM